VIAPTLVYANPRQGRRTPRPRRAHLRTSHTRAQAEWAQRPRRGPLSCQCHRSPPQNGSRVRVVSTTRASICRVSVSPRSDPTIAATSAPTCGSEKTRRATPFRRRRRLRPRSDTTPSGAPRGLYGLSGGPQARVPARRSCRTLPLAGVVLSDLRRAQLPQSRGSYRPHSNPRILSHAAHVTYPSASDIACVKPRTFTRETRST
jgi:hypothetical protein